ncbi:hypothetical protein ACIBO5_36360 [Nonomuraea angiospora]|uniref:hypothetical protein n=1 Tax=Nonomuraea angiospora TaxID=46172 RepID=UPI0037957E6F
MSDRDSPPVLARIWHAIAAYAYVFGVSPDSDMGRCPEPVLKKMDPAGGKGRRITPALVLGAVPLLLANWFVTSAILGRDCVVLYEGGNITDCGGLSEEEMSAASGLLALVMLVLQTVLIVVVSRRLRSRPQ